jgi:hypothetical protein
VSGDPAPERPSYSYRVSLWTAGPVGLATFLGLGWLGRRFGAMPRVEWRAFHQIVT